MKPVLSLVITCLTWLMITSISAMEQPNAPTHRLDTIINEDMMSGPITFIKKVSNDYLFVLNKYGTGRLFDIKNNYKRIGEWSFRQDYNSVTSNFENIFLYQTAQDEQLLVGFDCYKNLYACKIDSEYEIRIAIKCPCNFKIFPVKQSGAQRLIMINTDQKTTAMIDFEWKPLFKEIERACYKTVFLQTQPCNQIIKNHTIDEGSLVNCLKYYSNNRNEYTLLKEIFDTQSLADDQKDRLLMSDQSLRSINSHHKTPCGRYYLGHDGGFVTVWVPKFCNNQEL